MHRMKPRSFLPFVVLLLQACVGLGGDARDFPSLARRPVEMQGTPGQENGGAEATGEAAPQIADSGALGPQLDALGQQAERGGRAFDALYREVSPSIRRASGAPVLSENWVVAQEGLGRLEQARYDCVFALASLDSLYAERMNAAAGSDENMNVADIVRARASVLAIVDSQNDRVDALRAVLKHP